MSYEIGEYLEFGEYLENEFILCNAFRPIPEKDFVEAYIKAYYLTAPDMERWIREHKVYQ